MIPRKVTEFLPKLQIPIFHIFINIENDLYDLLWDNIFNLEQNPKLINVSGTYFGSEIVFPL